MYSAARTLAFAVHWRNRAADIAAARPELRSMYDVARAMVCAVRWKRKMLVHHVTPVQHQNGIQQAAANVRSPATPSRMGTCVTCGTRRANVAYASCGQEHPPLVCHQCERASVCEFCVPAQVYKLINRVVTAAPSYTLYNPVRPPNLLMCAVSESVCNKALPAVLQPSTGLCSLYGAV